MPLVQKSKLPRLAREWYQGHAVVFWTHTLEHRATGWLNERFHAAFRELLVHACARYQLVCPIYVLMPDHWHVVWMGLAAESDQRVAAAFLRQHLAAHLGAFRLQDRAHDHVLRAAERKRGPFESTCHYLRENPVRSGLVAAWEDWPHSGALVPGYPDLDHRSAEFWDRFWRIYARRCEDAAPGP